MSSINITSHNYSNSNWNLGAGIAKWKYLVINNERLGFMNTNTSKKMMMKKKVPFGHLLSHRRNRPHFSTPSSLDDHHSPISPDDDGDDSEDDDSPEPSDSPKPYSDNNIGHFNNKEINTGKIRENLEKIVGKDDSTFSGIDLATLIRNKYGRSYDVQLIKKRSFPLTEEEYILRLDDVANTLKCWGAVSHIRNSLQNSKERPRIGKAVSIFIDMDESGGRANEWIYK